nr:hypothetical protein [Tanacetum cinerariifolium]
MLEVQKETLRMRWIEKVEQVFEICKCAEEDKVMFADSTFEGRALTLWNENVHTLGLVNANHVLWTEFKSMMTTENCPATEIQRMEEELWTLTLKEDDIEAYNNRFTEEIKGNITSSRPTTLHDAINMARELVEQAVPGRAVKISESNKRKCKAHHLPGLCPPRCSNSHNLGHEEEDRRTRIQVARGNSLQNVTCFGCKEMGHYRDKCPRGRNPQNEGARGRAYVMITEEPQASLDFFVQDKMSRDVITVGSTMRIPLLYRGEYSQWRERQMHGSKYGEKDRKAAIFYEYETFKATEGEQLLDTYLHYLQYGTLMRQTKNLMDINIDALYNILKQNEGDVNDALGYKKKAVLVTLDPLALVAEKIKVTKRKEKVEVQSESEESDDEDISDLKKITALLAKAFNRKKYYAKPTNNNLRTSSASSFANKKQNPLALVVKKTKVSKRKEKVVVSLDSEGSDADDFSELKNITALLAKAFNRRKFYSKPTTNNLRTSSTSQPANKKQEFVKSDDKKVEKKLMRRKEICAKLSVINARRKDILPKTARKQRSKTTTTTRQRCSSDSDESSSSAEETIAKEQNNKFNEQMKVLNEKNADLLAQTEVLQDQLKVKHVVIDTDAECQAQYSKLEEERYEYMIRYSALCDNDKQHRKKIDKQEILFDKMSLQLVEMNNNVLRLQEKILEKRNENFRFGKVCFENPSYFKKAKDLRPSLYDEKVIGLGYTLMFLIHSDEALEIEKFKRARDNKIEFAYDYGNLNASYVNEKINFSDDYFQEIINPDFEKIDSPFQQTSSLKPYVPTVILEKIITNLEDEVVSLLEK